VEVHIRLHGIDEDVRWSTSDGIRQEAQDCGSAGDVLVDEFHQRRVLTGTVHHQLVVSEDRTQEELELVARRLAGVWLTKGD
jgi:hypothetical protein